MIYLLLIPVLLYVGWQLQNWYYWRKAIADSKYDQVTEPCSFTSAIVVPARNEADHIGELLEDLTELSALDYAPAAQGGTNYNRRPEIWVVNDYSSDGTERIVRSFDQGRIQLLQLADFSAQENIIAHKKAALTYAIQQTDADLVVTTDADCRWPKTVLAHIEQKYQQGANFICGPVLIARASNYCSGYQALDMAAYMLLTAAYQRRGRPILANGANLSFSRSLFLSISGYAGVDHIPSGDDVLLLQKALQSSETKTAFLIVPTAVVYTRAVKGWLAFWQQRLRWAGKTKAYTNPELTAVQGLSFLASLTLVIGLFLGLFYTPLLFVTLTGWALKATIDYLLLRDVCHHFQHPEWMKWYPFAMVFQPFYIVGIGVATLLGVR